MITNRLDGIDLSHWQAGTYDFAAAKAAGVKFVYHKATEGTTFTDPSYASRRQEVAAAGLIWGGYHFAHTEDDPTAQAEFFLSVATPQAGDLWPALDLEQNVGQLDTADLTAFVKTFVDVVHKATGGHIVLYTDFDLTDHFASPLWAYHVPPKVPTPWLNWHIAQTQAAVPGMGGTAIDVDTIAGEKPERLLARITL